ncbi:retron Ec67 family RNA-directed DNA polymerase/endonuclease [Pleomorphomonas sp. PLEO]|uniref:retron Ec67 family RNA-directed DNA polymerase/endonuclease n=1 Tax=Pleomorphomonas sp. PLEO TaxID=3239306 RepID=UPI00351F1A33
MSQLKKLKETSDRNELAALLGFKPSALTSIIYQTPLENRYTIFEIDKKSGGKRIIKAPTPKLKKLQTHLSHLLYQCLDEIERERGEKPLSFGFRRDLWIADNAACHKGRRWVLNLDLKDFFPSFNFGRVRGFFLKDKFFKLQPQVATTIAQIACDGVALPQGSPCSPVVSELIARILDMRLVWLAKKYRVTYTRYADDITFSTSQKDFPAGVAFRDVQDTALWILSDELLTKITGCGFEVNPEKTRMQFRGSRQSVTGLTVNKKVNVSSEYYRRARAMCDSLFSTGSYFRSMEKPDKEGGDSKPNLTNSLNPLEGILGHIYAVTQTEDRRDVGEQRIKPRAIRKLYRRFLFYKYFVALDVPLIVTEGKTDPVYLRAAVQSRTRFHPILGEAKGGSFIHAVHYFNYGGLSHEVLDLGGGGVGNLKSIPLDYRRNFLPKKDEHRAMAHKSMAYPVILVLDNDTGLGPVASTMKENFGVSFSVTSTASFYHITDNLYVVKTPETVGKSCIEDLLPKEWLEKELNGKRFNPKPDITKQYGKEVLANSVIKPNASQIDFSRFDPLLDRIVAVMVDYASKKSAH